MLTFDQVTTAWNTFFHQPESALSLAVFRIVWGALLIFNAMLMRKDLALLFGPEGYHPTAAFKKEQKFKFSLLNYLPSTNRSVYLIWTLYVIAALTLLCGFYTRTSSVIVFVTMISLHHRNCYVLSGGDIVQRLLGFLLIFSPAGAVLSVDCVLAGREFWEADLKFDPWAWRLVQIQISMVYLRSIFWKMKGKLWRNGTAVWFSIQQDEFSRARVPELLVNRFTIPFVTWSVMVVQLTVGTGVWFDELVYPVLLAGVAMHVMLDIFLNLQLFSWTMVASYLLFIQPHDLSVWLGLTTV